MPAVVFDLGKVLIDWDPRYLYRRLFADEAAMEEFLSSVCTMDWHRNCDGGLPMAENVRALSARHPDKADLIEAWDRDWSAMFAGPIQGSVDILERLHAQGVPLYAITNYPGDKWEHGLATFPFLRLFRDVVVSGKEGLTKPDPAIFDLACERFGIRPEDAVFIDDLPHNVAAARALGFDAHLFTGPETLADWLAERGLLEPVA
ncbi:HAD family hydrolase [Zavarzinia sp.]|uniref:HAD family hydrolase n=1 Tax=Zavarzinia sp. TaxID=2027920 RepID=UPI003569C36C